MGQKTNSNILRVGLHRNSWNSNYFEKNIEEHTIYNYQNVRIREYLSEFFKKNGFNVHHLKAHFNQKKLHIFVSYYLNKKSFISTTKSAGFKRVLRFKAKQKSKITTKPKLLTRISIEKLKLSSFLTNENGKFKTLKLKRLALLTIYNKRIQNTKYLNRLNLQKNIFTQQLLESLSLFTGKKFDIHLTSQNLNKGITNKLNKEEQMSLKKKILALKQYSRNPFFKESINTILIMSNLRQSAKIFSNFIAEQLTYLKKHNYFLIFLKRILIIFINFKFLKMRGIKVVINGRFNGAPRSKTRILLIGSIPIQSINKPINYSQTVSYTKNGTFGVKTWVN